MAYQKQVWREYDDTKTELQNALNGALATPERLNHIENGIANSADKAEVTAQLQQTEQELSSQLAQTSQQMNTTNSRIDGFMVLPEGANTGDAQLADMSVAANGFKYNTAGEALRKTQTGEALLDKAVSLPAVNFVNGMTNIVDHSKIQTNGRYAVSNNKVTLINDANFDAILIKVNPNTWYSKNRVIESTNFTMFADSNMNPLGLLSDVAEKNGANIFRTPSNALFLAFSVPKSSDLTDLVLILTQESIFDYTANDYPYNVGRKIKIPDLDNSTLRPLFSKVENVKESLLKNNNWIVFSSGSINQISENEAVWTGSNQYAGLRSQTFNSNNDSVKVTVSGLLDGLTNVDLMLYYDESNGDRRYESLDTSAGSTFEMSFTFDPANYAVYKNAVRFGALVRNTSSSGSGTITIKDIKVIEQDIELLDIYNPQLDKTILNIGNKLSSLESSSSVSTDDLFISNGAGDAFKIQVDLDGQLFSTPTIPQKTLFMGNSILLSMNNPGGENFGMCASSSKHDYYWHVSQAILAKNPNATFDKLHVGALESGTTLSDYEQYIATNDAYFRNDLNLVVLQIGDNVNTPARADYFRQVFPLFLQHLRTKASKCRVIVVGTWFGVTYSLSTLTELAPKHGADLVTINDLRTKENEGHSGQVITYDDGTTGVVSDNWITHPGDLGMQRIAERIINKMHM